MSNELPKDWRWVKLGEICGIVYGKGLPTKNLKNDGFPVFGANGIIGFNDRYIYDNPMVLISCRGAYSGKINFSPAKCYVTNNSLVLDIKNEGEIDKAYLFYSLTAAKKNKLISGTAQPQVTINNAVELQIPLPPKPTQQAIVSKIEELFSEIEKGIESLFTAQRQLKTYRQSVLKWAFEGKLTNSLNSRNNRDKYDTFDLHDEHDLNIAAEPADGYNSKNHGNQDNPVNQGLDKGELPEGWKIVELKEVCEIKRGKSKHRPRNEPSLYGGKYPFIQTGDIRNASGRYINEYSQTYNEQGLQQSKLWPKGTLCITIAANIGETAILGFDACFPDSVVGLLCNEKMLLNKYTNYFFISFKQRLEDLAPATAQKNINVDILEKVRIPLPSIEEQNKIVQEIESRLSVAHKMEESITQSLQQAEVLRQSILKKAFEGRLT